MKFFKNLSIPAKLTLSFSVMVAVILLVAGAGLFATSKVKSADALQIADKVLALSGDF